MNSKQPPDEGLKESRRARDSFFVRNQDETIIWQAGSSGMIFGTEQEIMHVMDLPKVIIKENYTDYLNGKEVEATVIGKGPVEKGMHVMGFHNSIAVNTGFSVPKEKQSHYIGVEGLVTEINAASPGHHPRIKVIKL